MSSGETAGLGPKARWIGGAGLLALVAAALFFAGSTRSRGVPSAPQHRGEPGAPARTRPVYPADESRIATSFGNLPLSFEPNQGQTDSQVKFLSRNPHYNLFLTSSEAVFTLPVPSPKGSRAEGRIAKIQRGRVNQQAVLRMKILGANRTPRVEAAAPIEGNSNYLTGHDSSKWVRDVPQYARVNYGGIYPGVDLTFYGEQHQLEFDFLVKPGASPATIALGVEGASKIRTDTAGDLVLTSAAGDLRLHKPVAYQRQGELRQPVDARFVVKGTQVALAVGDYDRSRELVIDPSVAYSTYLGGGNEDDGFGIAVDTTGAAYVTGQTFSPAFPKTIGSAFVGSQDAFVTKLKADGTGLVYSTFLGGSSGATGGNAIAVDGTGNAYVVGSTTATNFPTAGTIVPQLTSGGGQDAFVSKLSANGSTLLYSTYLGGANDEIGFGVAVDTLGAIYAVGQTKSSDFPTAAPIQGVRIGASDGFVTKIGPTGALAFSDYLGGSLVDEVTGVALDSSANFYVSGITFSTDFHTTPGVFQFACTGCGTVDHSFVTAIKPTVSGFAYIYSTYLHGSGVDEANLIAVDASSNAYVVGLTSSTDFPTNGTVTAFQPTLHSGATSNAFISKLNPAGTALLYSTYLGGSGADNGIAIAVDSSNNAYVTGVTTSTNFPTTGDATQPANAGGQGDAFVTKLNTAAGGTAGLVFSTYLGGSKDENAAKISGIALDLQSPPNFYVTGETNSTNFPVIPGSFQTTYSGSTDAFVVKYTPLAPQFTVTVGAISPTAISRGSTGTATVTVTSTGLAGTVNLGCSVSATAAPPTCSLSPTSVSLTASGSQTSTLTITTVKTAMSPLTGAALWLPLMGLAFAGAGLLSDPARKRKQLAIVLCCLAFAGLLLMAGCGSGNYGGGGGGGGGGGTTTGSYTVTVTGSVVGTGSANGAGTFSVQ